MILSCDIVKVLNAVDLSDRYKAALPLVLRQIEVGISENINNN